VLLRSPLQVTAITDGAYGEESTWRPVAQSPVCVHAQHMLSIYLLDFVAVNESRSLMTIVMIHVRCDVVQLRDLHFFGVRFPAIKEVHSIAFGRDNSHKYGDRSVGAYTLQYCPIMADENTPEP